MPKFNAEHLRPLEYMASPDPRWSGFGGLNIDGIHEPITIERYAEPIQKIKLNTSVPELVVIHFETAKNLALYAWNVYRFTPVAELYAYISIELALRDITGDKKRPFKKLFEKAIENKILSNEKFSRWKHVTEQREHQYQERIELAQDLDIEGPKPPEYWNYLDVIVKNIPYFRNDYAHGSTNIYPWAYTALKDSAEIINQLYETRI
ncbi:hypothetical protein [Shewanella sp. S1-49-MNA-CIBAN-0167]|jgi:hypothetical protein|uniref:hypothetical protein n=1 Tax=Shewanella sp. S1-49-MNA-CIBAN-0167 TaxID=3140468 RepID=UPI00333350FF